MYRFSNNDIYTGGGGTLIVFKLVHKVLEYRFLIRWPNNFGDIYGISIGWFIKSVQMFHCDLQKG